MAGAQISLFRLLSWPSEAGGPAEMDAAFAAWPGLMPTKAGAFFLRMACGTRSRCAGAWCARSPWMR